MITLDQIMTAVYLACCKMPDGEEKAKLHSMIREWKNQDANVTYQLMHNTLFGLLLNQIQDGTA